MLDRDKYHKILEESAGRDITDVISVEKDVKPLAQQCIDMGAGFVLLKCGAPGVFYQSSGNAFAGKLTRLLGHDYESFSAGKGFEASYVPGKVRSGTGAGDTTIGAFLTAMLEGYPLQRCLQFAVATGASCVETYDALSGLKSFEELAERIDGGWKKNPVRI